MGPNPDSLRERLLAQHVPPARKLEEYRKEVQTMLDRNEKTLRREKWYASALWFYVVACATAFLVWMGTSTADWMGAKTAAVVSVGAFLLFVYIAAAVELLKHFINRSRVEMLKEVKGLEMQLLELREALRTRSSP
jgi:hypothetical protein